MQTILAQGKGSRSGMVVMLLAFVLSACAVKSAVRSYAEPGADLRRFHAYSWGPAEILKTGDPRLDSNEIFQRHLQAAVERELAAKGLAKNPAVPPDLLVHYHASVTQRIDLSQHEPFTACPDCKPFVYDAGTLVIDLVDAQTGKVVWRGWSEGNVDGVVGDQRWLEERIDRDVTRIFARWPH